MQYSIFIFILLVFFSAHNSGNTTEIPSNFTLATSSTSPPVWNFTIPRQASRTTGVAPLAVHFSAGLTESSPGNIPFHDYEYSWNFGDSTSGTWGTSGRSKNTDKGPVAYHVYETPGTYVATLAVKNGNGVIDTSTFSITVQDPESVFSGTKTTCISTGSDFSGCPAGSTQITTSDLSVLSNYTLAGFRVLLRRGDSWSLGTNISFPNSHGPVHIGAFGTCSTPDVETGICSNAPQVNLANAGTNFLNTNGKWDWRLVDISFQGEKGVTGYAFGGGWNSINNLAFRVKIIGSTNGFLFSSWRNNDSEWCEGNSVVSSYSSGASVCPAYIGGERFAILGNKFHDAGQHTLRVWQLYQGIINHNILSGASSSYNGHNLKLHGPAPYGEPGGSKVGTYAETGGSGLRQFTKLSVVSNNIFGGGVSWPVSIEPQNNSYDERISDVIIEKNRVVADYIPGTGKPDHLLITSGRYVTIKNNIIDSTGGGSGVTGISISRRGVEPTPLGNRIYNNTIYSGTNHSLYATGISVDASASDTIVKNNYVSFPNTSTKNLLVDYSGTVIAKNTITNSPYFVDPNNSSPLTRDFRLTSSAILAISQGDTAPIYDDYFGTERITPVDLGAVKYTLR